MNKFCVFYNKENGKYETRKAEVVGRYEDGYILKIGDLEIRKNFENVFDDKAYTDIVKKEMIISKAVKQKAFKGKYYTCPICGKKIRRDEATVDHKIPKRYFNALAKKNYNVDDIRLVQTLWSQCWHKDNLQVVCSSCNKRKGGSTKILSNMIKRKSYNQKKYEGLNRVNRKIHVRRNSFISQEVVMDIVKQYGNTFSIDMLDNNRKR